MLLQSPCAAAVASTVHFAGLTNRWFNAVPVASENTMPKMSTPKIWPCSLIPCWHASYSSVVYLWCRVCCSSSSSFWFSKRVLAHHVAFLVEHNHIRDPMGTVVVRVQRVQRTTTASHLYLHCEFRSGGSVSRSSITPTFISEPKDDGWLVLRSSRAKRIEPVGCACLSSSRTVSRG